jgi:hypothetical protein
LLLIQLPTAREPQRAHAALLPHLCLQLQNRVVSTGLRHWQRRQRDDGGRGGERRVELSAQHCSLGGGFLQLRGD